jgi:hypothetical protein
MRPTPDAIAAVVAALGPTGETVRIPAIVARVREQTGCSRATAYRAVADAIQVGAICRSNGVPDQE